MAAIFSAYSQSTLPEQLVRCFECVYGETGSMGDWEKQDKKEPETVSKGLFLSKTLADWTILHQFEKTLNVFLLMRGLPQAVYTDCHGKEYLVLTLTAKEYEEKILPIRNQFETKLEEFKASLGK